MLQIPFLRNHQIIKILFLFYFQKQLPHLDIGFNFAIIVLLVSYGFELNSFFMNMLLINGKSFLGWLLMMLHEKIESKDFLNFFSIYIYFFTHIIK